MLGSHREGAARVAEVVVAAAVAQENRQRVEEEEEAPRFEGTVLMEVGAGKHSAHTPFSDSARDQMQGRQQPQPILIHQVGRWKMKSRSSSTEPLPALQRATAVRETSGKWHRWSHQRVGPLEPLHGPSGSSRTQCASKHDELPRPPSKTSQKACTTSRGKAAAGKD